jgi:hypothetical protein
MPYAKGEVGLLPLPKCAFTSISAALDGRGWTYIGLKEYAALPVRYSFWRHPAQRLEAAYGQHLIGMPNLPPFAQWVCTSAMQRDPHTASQYDHGCLQGRFVVNRIIRWDFSLLAKIIGAPAITHLNEGTTVATEWTEAAHSRFIRAYRRDLRLWHCQPLPVAHR